MVPVHWATLVVGVALGVFGCAERGTPERAPAPAAASASMAPAPGSASIPVAAPDPPHEPYVALAVEGFRDAIVALPADLRAPSSVIVALHGNYDRPEWQCEVWRGIVGPRPFVLCPRGEPRTDAPRGADRWTWGAYAAVEREVLAAIAALRVHHARSIDGGPLVLVGFSLGATMAARLATRSEGRYSHLVIVEGGFDGWTRASAANFIERGGVRVLAACGQSSCMTRFRGLTRVFEGANVPFRVANGGSAGHTYDGSVAEAVSAEWTWFSEGRD